MVPLRQASRISTILVAFSVAALAGGGLPAAAASDPAMGIVAVQPTLLFPKTPVGAVLCQQVRLSLSNRGAAQRARVKVLLDGKEVFVEDLGQVAPGASVKTIRVPDVARPAELVLQVYPQGSEQPLATWKSAWQPQRKWKVYCVSYSHHDLGFGNYPHRLRTDIRHGNIERPLQYCRETEPWDDDSKFRFVIETSEPITSYLGTHSEAEALELARRIREGRIQIGGVHNTANTEQLSYELMARLFYLSNRHSRDLLSIPPSRTVLIDDVIGLTWPLATFCKEAGLPYFFHGHNGCAACLQPANAEPVFYWQSPDGDTQRRVLVRSWPYGGYGGDSLGDGSEAHVEKVLGALAAARWPYDAALLQNGTDFELVTMENAAKIRAWNSRWAYPRLVCATMDMFFDAVAAQTDPAKVKTFAKDGNNQWADQDSTDAWLLAEARRQGEAIPTAEKLSTIATVLSGGGYPWSDIYQAYHRLLQYHEHTDAAAGLGRGRDAAQYYETELEENREMVAEAKEFCDAARERALERLSQSITTQADKTLIVFNPLARTRTDLARVAVAELPKTFRLVDAATGKQVPCQTLPDSALGFVAADVPSLGYKSYRVVPGAESSAAPAAVVEATVLENRFYRVAFDRATGGITSIRDKELNVELVDSSAPHRFNEYLYERFETPRIEDPSKWYRVQSAKLSASRGPVAEAMTVAASATGVESLRQTVSLYHDMKRIDFALDLVKSPSGRDGRSAGVQNKESVYAALPLAIADFQIRHDLPGAVVEPIRQQFAGSCTAYYAVRHFSDISNRRYGVTVSSPEAALVEYGRARSCPIMGPWPGEGGFEKTLEYPANSRMYLYLMDNMFDCNIRLDQRGPVRFTWSMRSHEGDWRVGKADQFGWDVHNPLLVKLAAGRKQAALPETSSFVSVNPPNVVCGAIKPAEANGAGIILRFHETQGTPAKATVALPFFGKIAAANETSLVEEDLPAALEIAGDHRLSFMIRPFGVKTIRVRSAAPALLPAVSRLEAKAVSDMQTDLAWQAGGAGADRLSHYHVYRGTRPDFAPTLLHLVGRPVAAAYRDEPKLNYGGWINNRLEPGTTYYYKVAAVDRWNREGPPSAAVVATTLKSSEHSAVPLRVEGLRAILVSPLSRFNYVNLLFRTNCESDVRRYEIHRATAPGFAPSDATRIGTLNADAILPGAGGYGRVPVDHRLRDYDHLMHQDDAVQPATTYYYRVCAVDNANQKGPYSREAAVRTKDPGNLWSKASAQSIYSGDYPAELAIDGDPDPHAAWISAPYGGGTKQQPRDTWLVIELPRPVKLKGVKIIGDYRQVIPLQEKYQVQCRVGQEWRPAAAAGNSQKAAKLIVWPVPILTEAIRLDFPARDLPKSADPAQDGIVRVAEVLLVLEDGKEIGVSDLPTAKP